MDDKSSIKDGVLSVITSVTDFKLEEGDLAFKSSWIDLNYWNYKIWFGDPNSISGKILNEFYDDFISLIKDFHNSHFENKEEILKFISSIQDLKLENNEIQIKIDGKWEGNHGYIHGSFTEQFLLLLQEVMGGAATSCEETCQAHIH
jgi:hypothetical protein